MISLTGDLNELLSTSTFLLSVHALLGDLTSSLSAGNAINKEDVQLLICTAKKVESQRNTAHLLTFQEHENRHLMMADKMLPGECSCFWKGRGGRPPSEIL